MKQFFSIERWKSNESAKVVDENDRPVKIVKLGLAPQFWKFVPKDVDPSECYTIHAIREGSNVPAVLVEGEYHNLFIINE